jgi:hypothetical protein
MAISTVRGIYHEWLIGLGRLWNEWVISFTSYEEMCNESKVIADPALVDALSQSIFSFCYVFFNFHKRT